jgi:hypothetical protein
MKFTSTIVVYDLESGQLKREIPVPGEPGTVTVHNLRITPNGQRILFIAFVQLKDGFTTSCWVTDAAGPNVRQVGEESKTNFLEITGFASNNKTIGILYGPRMRLFDTETGKEIAP